MPGKYYDRKKFAQRLAQLMEEHNDTIYTLAEFLRMSPSAISRYTSANMTPKILTVEAISSRYNVNPVWLMGAETDKYLDGLKKPAKSIPVIGTIAAGTPILAQENIEGYEFIPDDVRADFCLRVKGDSMIGARILDGDLVCVRKQPEVENGEIAAVLIDGEATLKRFYKLDNTIVLRAENPNYKDKVYSKKDMKQVSILGKAIYFKSEVR